MLLDSRMRRRRRAFLMACVTAGIFIPCLSGAQRVVASQLSHRRSTNPTRATAAQHPLTASAFAPHGDTLSPAALTLDPPRRARGPIALRGLAWGAVTGGVIGYYLKRDEEYGGAIGGPILGAVLGAPIGMVVFLFATPL